MEFYIRTRGDALDQGYRWIRLNQDGRQELADPPQIRYPEINELVYGEDFSVLLVRTGQELTLQVTGLNPTGQSQRKRRNVQNILLCVGTPDEERTLRGIAVTALQEDMPLATLVDEHIIVTPEAPPGFRVNPALPERLLALQANAAQTGIDRGERIGHDLDTYRRQLVQELDRYALPAQRTGTLVVVTRHRTRDVLQRAQVWRGLSDMPEQPATVPTVPVTPQRRASATWLLLAIVIVSLIGLAGLMFILLP